MYVYICIYNICLNNVKCYTYIYIYIYIYIIFVCLFYFFLNVRVYYKWNNITLKLLKRVSVIFGLFQNLLQTSSNKTPSMCIYIIYIVHSEDISVIYIYIFNWYIYIYIYIYIPNWWSKFTYKKNKTSRK